MFKEARIKLTVWYLAIIMALSFSFSGVIYIGINRELVRIEDLQRNRIQGIIRGFPIPIDVPPGPDSDVIAESRARLILTLGLINLGIFIFSGLGGYFLAGLTLDPIKEMVDDQKDFISNASHELRTPLTSLMTEIEVALRDKKMTLADAKELLASNLDDVKKMNKLSNNLLKLSRLSDGDIEPKFKQVDLKAVVERAVDNFDTKVTLKLKTSKVYGNEEALVELVTILLDNAIKYSTKNKVIIVQTKNKTLTVQDFGIGISKADIPHIFDRFYRADVSRSKGKTDGYGLGLSIAKSIADKHGADIKVQSKVGVGSTFTVAF